MARKETGDIAAGRLDPTQLARNFSDVSPPLDRQRALIEASRCHFCFDAPCIQACPTAIDIPGFIRAISTDNLRGAAHKILDANIFGGQCARVCPTEILCEGDCVRNAPEEKPVEIGALQRYATDWVIRDRVSLFTRAATTGKRVAVVGAGPAGLSCAHALAMHGHEVEVFEARAKSGGLNEYGIAAYKVVDFSQHEVEWLLSIGGICVHHGKALGRDIALSQLRRDFDAVFLAMGLAGVNAMGVGDERLPGVRDAVDFIEELRQAEDKSTVPVGRRVVVIGGGNTAIDAAVQSKRLGAERVTLVYRRSAEAMSAWLTCAAISSASSRPIRSGWPRRRRPTRPTTSCAPSRRAGAAWCGRRWARRARRSSTSTARATAPSGAPTAGCSASTTSS
jgi:dihydropyrimidine dehydrogenase (NAD+) subunit PreT